MRSTCVHNILVAILTHYFQIVNLFVIIPNHYVTIQRMLPFPYRRSRTAVGAHKPLLANEKSVK